MSKDKKTYKFKITLFGTANVGKTSLILRFIQDSFSQDMKKTIGTSFMIKEVVLKDANIRLLVWDIGGEAQFSSMRSVYFKGSNAALGVYDITSPDSILKIPSWVSSIQKSVGKIPMILLGNKIDLAKEQQRVDKKDSLDLAKKLECEHMYTSALTGENVEQAFIKIAQKSLEIARSFEE